MKQRHWRELVEIVGVVAIVASLLLLAAEVRQSNRIATARAEVELTAAFNLLQARRATNSDFAKLFPKLESPEAHLTTATDASQIRGIAWHYVNALWSVHTAYENGLLSRDRREHYVSAFASTLQRWPGLAPHYVQIYTELEPMHDMKVFAPIAELVASQGGETE